MIPVSRLEHCPLPSSFDGADAVAKKSGLYRGYIGITLTGYRDYVGFRLRGYIGVREGEWKRIVSAARTVKTKKEDRYGMGYSQNYESLVVLNYRTAHNIQGYQDRILIFRTTHTVAGLQVWWLSKCFVGVKASRGSIGSL